jgi:hypothetical protein
MIDKTRDPMQEQILAALDERAANLDAVTLARLAAARRAAVARRRSAWSLGGRRWQTVGGLALAASLAIGLSLWRLHGPLQGPASPSPAELELLAEDEDLELLDRLEFYRWLEQESQQLAGNGDST